MSTPAFLKTLEREVYRPIINIIFPRPYRVKAMQIAMKVYLFFKPIKYNYIQGNTPLGKKLCVFVSYQPRGILPTTWKYIKHLQERLGYSVVFISNCPLQKQDIPYLQGICHEVIERDNIGYDFGAYKDGILRYIQKMGNEFNNLESLLIANDSVIGPIYDMLPIYEKMQAEDCDFWGMNDFFEDRDVYKINTKSIPHVCSYFICFKTHLLKTEVFKKLWRQMQYPNGRKIAIRTEKKVGQYFLNNKFSYSVYIKKEEIIEYMYRNPDAVDRDLFFNKQKLFYEYAGNNNRYLYVTHSHSNDSAPMLTLTHFGMPLMKRDLIKKDIINMSIFKAILNIYEKQLTGIVTKEEILDEMGLNPRTQNSIFKWKKYII
ncbi:MAG: hypothetical protein ACI9CD_000622 [Candidatus Deianiraeaceae bacterium]|jgi:hypothetical protein